MPVALGAWTASGGLILSTVATAARLGYPGLSKCGPSDRAAVVTDLAIWYPLERPHPIPQPRKISKTYFGVRRDACMPSLRTKINVNDPP